MNNIIPTPQSTSKPQEKFADFHDPAIKDNIALLANYLNFSDIGNFKIALGKSGTAYFDEYYKTLHHAYFPNILLLENMSFEKHFQNTIQGIVKRMKEEFEPSRYIKGDQLDFSVQDFIKSASGTEEPSLEQLQKSYGSEWVLAIYYSYHDGALPEISNIQPIVLKMIVILSYLKNNILLDKIFNKYEASFLESDALDDTIYFCAASGNIEELKPLLTQLLNILETDQFAGKIVYKALFYAINAQKSASVDLLMSYIQEELSEEKRQDIIYWASSRGSLEVLEFLLKHIEVNDEYNPFHEGTILSLAAENGHTHIVEYLLDSYSYQESDDDIGFSFKQAACNEQFAVMKLLWERAEKIISTDTKEHVLEIIMEFEDDREYEDTIVLLKLFSTSTEENIAIMAQKELLCLAASKAHEDTVKSLLDTLGDRVNAVTKDRALENAAVNGHLSVVKLLISASAGPKISVKARVAALLAAVDDEHLEVEHFLFNDIGNSEHFLQALFDSSRHIQGRALIWVARNGHLEILKPLLESIKPNNFNKIDKKRALFWATDKGEKAATILLLDYMLEEISSDLNFKREILFNIVMKGDLMMLEFLLEPLGAHLRTEDKEHAFREAPNDGCFTLIKLLFENIGIENMGAEVLLWASTQGHLLVVEFLLNRLLDLSPEDKKEACSKAFENGHTAVVNILSDEDQERSPKRRKIGASH